MARYIWEVRDVERTARFWEEMAGFQRRTSEGGSVALGTGAEDTAGAAWGRTNALPARTQRPVSLRVHTPTARDFAAAMKRFMDRKYPIAPTDHTMSKAFYLDDPDGIHIEFTLETPERFREARMVGNQPVAVAADGEQRPITYPLDLPEVFRAYEPGSENEPAVNGTRVGHVHLYVADLEKSHAFYKGLGLQPSTYWPQIQFADLGAGGRFTHRMAVNTWQGRGVPPSPAGSARMRHFEMRFTTPQHLHAALTAYSSAVETDEYIELVDPAGITLRIAKTAHVDAMTCHN